MGTRNLTVIIKDNKIKLSQYGQWDGYFSYSGKKFVEFVRENLKDSYYLEKFAGKVELLRPVNSEQVDTITKLYNDLKKNREFFQPFNYMFPQFSRDTGIDILNIINGLNLYEFNENQGFPVYLQDSDWCEFIYIINLDTNEIYMLTSHEFNIEPLETCPLVEKEFGNCCWYKSKIKNLPSVKTISKYNKQIGLD